MLRDKNYPVVKKWLNPKHFIFNLRSTVSHHSIRSTSWKTSFGSMFVIFAFQIMTEDCIKNLHYYVQLRQCQYGSPLAGQTQTCSHLHSEMKEIVNNKITYQNHHFNHNYFNKRLCLQWNWKKYTVLEHEWHYHATHLVSFIFYMAVAHLKRRKFWWKGFWE